MYGCDFVYDTPSGREANVNNSTNSKTFITYRRARQKMAHSSLAVTEICIIIASKVRIKESRIWCWLMAEGIIIIKIFDDWPSILQQFINFTALQT